jgi:hypothetical protein
LPYNQLMLRRISILLSGLFLPGSVLLAQSITRLDTIFSDTVPRTYNYYFDIPFGQTFINPNNCSGYSLLRTKSFDPMLYRSMDLKRSGESNSAYISWGTPTGANTEGTYVENSGQDRVVRNQISNLDYSAEGIEKNILEFKPDNNIPVNLVMSLGFGSARLNLSNLMMKSADISTAEADVVILLNYPNTQRMGTFLIKAGTSEILFRNPEFSHADKIIIQNGMGNTTLALGNICPYPTQIYVEVGAGECTVSLSETTPLKIIAKDNGLTADDLPGDFIQKGDNIFVNLPFQKAQGNAVTITVDMGMGTFKIIPYKQ